MNRFIEKKRIASILIALFLIPLGLFSKSYHGIWHDWVHDSVGGIIYVVFWCMVLFSFFPQGRYTLRISIFVFILTSILEFMQLWHTPFLELIRFYRLGQYLIGTTFVWSDFFYYIVGTLISLGIMKVIIQFEKSN